MLNALFDGQSRFYKPLGNRGEKSGSHVSLFIRTKISYSVNIHLKIDGANCIVHYFFLALQDFLRFLYKKFISVADFGG